MKELLLVGDRVLIEPQDEEQLTEAGLLLPATVKEKEKVQTGRVVSIGPGYIMPNPDYMDGEPWKQTREVVRYIPLQARAGDFAFFMRKEAIAISYKKKKYLILQHGAILALIRSDKTHIPDHLDAHMLDEQ